MKKRDSWPRIVMANSQSRDSARLVLIALAEHADCEDCACVPQSRLSELTMVEPRQVRRAIQSLIAMGEIEVRTKGDGRGNVTEYRLILSRSNPFFCLKQQGRQRNPFKATKQGRGCPPLDDSLILDACAREELEEINDFRLRSETAELATPAPEPKRIGGHASTEASL